MCGVSVVNPPEVEITMKVLGVGVHLEMVAMELETAKTQDHGLDNSIGACLDQMMATLKCSG